MRRPARSHRFVAVILRNYALGWIPHGTGTRAVATHFAAIVRSSGCGDIRVDEAGIPDAACSEALDNSVLVVDILTSLDEDFNRVTAPQAQTTY